MKHKLLFFLVALLSTMTAWAQFTVDGLRYTVLNEDSKTVELTSCIGYKLAAYQEKFHTPWKPS